MAEKGTRKQFESVKRQYYKHNPKICKRCGSTKYIQLHHIVPFQITHDNSFSNLIPLCNRCHTESHNCQFYMNFDQFMNTPPYHIMAYISRKLNITQNRICDVQDIVLKCCKARLQMLEQLYCECE